MMTSTPNLSRRKWLRTGSAAATLVALSPTLSGCSHTDYDEKGVSIRLRDTEPVGSLTELVRLATLAPSGHNTQPWKFATTTDAIRIYPDFTRRVSVVDPNDRELWISLGGALENLIIAAEYAGYQSEATYNLAGSPSDHIAVSLKKDGVKSGGQSLLFAAIHHRQCTRTEYDGKPIPVADLNKLATSATGVGITPTLFTGAAAMKPIQEYVNAGNDRQLSDDNFTTELTNWLRFSDREAVTKLDGLASRASGNPSIPRWVAERFIGSILNPKAQNKTDNAGIESSSGMVLFVSGKNDRAAWIETGRAYERFALLATAMNIKNAFLNQPCEVPELRTQLQAQLNLNGAFPQLLARFGRGPATPQSMRRPVSDVLV